MKNINHMHSLSDGKMISRKHPFSPDASAARKKRRVQKTTKKFILFSLGFLLILLALSVIVRPYRRLEKLAKRVIAENAPRGTRVGGVEMSFPLSITLTKLDLPLRVNGREQRIHFEKLTGNVSFLPILNGVVDAEMNSDFFGGLLWVRVKTKAMPSKSPGNVQEVLYEARARRVDLSQVCDFLQAPIPLAGRLDVDAEGTLDEKNPASVTGQALAIGKAIDIPPIELDPMALPANHVTDVVAKLLAEKGAVSIQDFKLSGSAYDISGTGKIVLKDPLQKSLVNLSPAIVFKERFTITDPRISGGGSDSIADALISSKTKVFFKITGTVEQPQAQLDPASSLAPLMSLLNR